MAVDLVARGLAGIGSLVTRLTGPTGLTGAAPSAYAVTPTTGQAYQGMGAVRTDAATLYCFAHTGQSPAYGVNVSSSLAINTGPSKYQGIMWMADIGLRARLSLNATITDFVDLREADAGENGHETICSGFAWAGIKLVYDAVGAYHQQFHIIFARSGQPYANTKRGGREDQPSQGVPHQELIRRVQEVEIVARRKGLRTIWNGIYRGGEEDTGLRRTFDEEDTYLYQYQQDLQADIQAINGQRDPVRLFVTTTNKARSITPGYRPGVMLAQAKKRGGLIVPIGTTYSTARGTRDIHELSPSYVYSGEREGAMVARHLFGLGARPPRVLDDRVRWIDRKTILATCDVEFPPLRSILSGPIDLTGLGTGYGLFVVIEGGVLPIATVSVQRDFLAQSPDLVELKIVLASEAPWDASNPVLCVATVGTGLGFTGPVLGPRCAWADSNPYVSQMDGTNLPSYLQPGVYPIVGLAAGVPPAGWNLLQPLPAGATFTRSGGGTTVDATGLLVTVGSDVLRTRYDPASGVALGVLLEAASTNLATYSEAADNAVWDKSAGLTVSADVSAALSPAPDGSASMDKLVETAATGTHRVVRTFAGLTIGQRLTHSLWLRAAERSGMKLNLFGTTNIAFATFDTALATRSATGGLSGFAAGMEDWGNGLYRCWVSGLIDATSVTIQETLQDDSGASSYAGDTAKGIYCWGRQTEVGKLSSYIPATGASSASRSADALALPFGQLGQANGSNNEVIYFGDRSIAKQTLAVTVTAGVGPIVAANLNDPLVREVRVA